MLSRLQLNDVKLEKLMIRAEQDCPVNLDQQDYRVTISHKALDEFEGSGARWLRLRVRLDPAKESAQKARFDAIDIVIKGRFSFATDTNEEDKKKLFPLAAVSILFGIARGIVGQATGMFPGGAFLLPPVDVTAAASQKKLAFSCSLISTKSDKTLANIGLK